MRLDFHKNHRLLFGVVFFGFIGLSVLIAVGPALWVQSHNEPLPGSRPLTPTEQRGLEVYVSEGCVYCHTQQVRPIPQDTARYGRASAPGDYARLKPTGPWRQTPSVLGTERTGPDLSNIGERQPSEMWHHIHLYQPRAVVGGSPMPAFPWLYEVKSEPDAGQTVIPIPGEYAPEQGRVLATERAEALVAYLLSREQAPLPGRSGEDRAPPGGDGSVDGSRVYANRCASCHQGTGEGIEGIYPPLAGDPVVTAEDPTRHIRVVLFGLRRETIGGVEYPSPMPPWGDRLSDREVAAVVNHERTSWGNNAPTVSPEDVARVREEGSVDER